MIPIAGYHTVGQQTPRRVTRTLQIAGNPVRVVFDEAKLRRLSSRFKGAYNTAKDRIPARFAARLVADPDYSEEIKLSLTGEQQREFLRWAEAVSFRVGYRRTNPVLAALDGQNNVFGSWEPAETPGLVSRGQLLEFDLTRPTVAVTKTIVVERDLPAVVGTAVYRLQVDNGDRVAGGQPVPSSLQEQLYSLPAYGATSLEELRRTTTVETPASAIITTVAGSAHYQFRRDQAILAAWERLPEFTRALTEAIVWEATDTALLTTLLARLLPPFACGVPPVYSFLDRQRVFAPSSVDSPVARMVAIFAALTLLVEPFGGDDPGVDTRQLLRYYLPELNVRAAPLGDQDDVLRANFPDVVDPNWLRASVNIGVFLNRPDVRRDVVSPQVEQPPAVTETQPEQEQEPLIGPAPPPAEIEPFFTDQHVKRLEPPFPPTFEVTDLPGVRVMAYRKTPGPWVRQVRRDTSDPMVWVDDTPLTPGEKYEYIFRGSNQTSTPEANSSFARYPHCGPATQNNPTAPHYRDQRGRAQDCVFRKVIQPPLPLLNVRARIDPEGGLIVLWNTTGDSGRGGTDVEVRYSTENSEGITLPLAAGRAQIPIRGPVRVVGIRARAVGVEGTASPWTDAVPHSVDIPEPPPGRPQGINLDAPEEFYASGQWTFVGGQRELFVELKWRPGPPLNYERFLVERRRADGVWEEVLGEAHGDFRTGYWLRDFDVGWDAAYNYRIFAVNAEDIRSAPFAGVGRTPPAPPAPPPPPDQVRASLVDGDILRVGVVLPPGADGIQARYILNGEEVVDTRSTFMYSAAADWFQRRMPAGGTLQGIEVRTYNEGGFSPWTNAQPAEIQVPPPKPTRISLRLDTPATSFAEALEVPADPTRSQAIINISVDSSDAVELLRVERRNIAEDVWRPLDIVERTGPGTWIVDRELAPLTEYVYRVWSVTGGVRSTTAQLSDRITTPPRPPVVPHITLTAEPVEVGSMRGSYIHVALQQPSDTPTAARYGLWVTVNGGRLPYFTAYRSEFRLPSSGNANSQSSSDNPPLLLRPGSVVEVEAMPLNRGGRGPKGSAKIEVPLLPDTPTPVQAQVAEDEWWRGRYGGTPTAEPAKKTGAGPLIAGAAVLGILLLAGR